VFRLLLLMVTRHVATRRAFGVNDARRPTPRRRRLCRGATCLVTINSGSLRNREGNDAIHVQLRVTEGNVTGGDVFVARAAVILIGVRRGRRQAVATPAGRLRAVDFGPHRAHVAAAGAMRAREFTAVARHLNAAAVLVSRRAKKRAGHCRKRDFCGQRRVDVSRVERLLGYHVAVRALYGA
jgi:hypothetical protein